MIRPFKVFLSVLVVGLVAVACIHAEAAKKRVPNRIVWFQFEQGMKLSKKYDKPTMIHFTTEWCGWCRRLEKEVYTVPEVIKASRNFVCIRVDGSKRRQIVNYYKIRGYPTILFTNSKRKEVHRLPGYVPAERFLAEMERALKKATPEDDTKEDATEEDDTKRDDSSEEE